jgi:hypothetical protein
MAWALRGYSKKPMGSGQAANAVKAIDRNLSKNRIEHTSVIIGI